MLRIRAVALAVALAVMAGGAGAATAQEPAGTEWLQLADQAAAEVASSYPFVERAGQNIRVWWISPLAW